jgi:hypothetical protein
MPTTYEKFGDQNYRFGIDDPNALTLVDGMAVESLNIEGTPEFESEAKNAEGMTASYVRGKDKYSFTASGYLIDEAAFDAVTNFTFQGRFFIINKRSKNHSNTDFTKCEISGVSYFLITS